MLWLSTPNRKDDIFYLAFPYMQVKENRHITRVLIRK